MLRISLSSMYSYFKNNWFYAILVIIPLILLFNCDFNTKPPFENKPPSTTITNIPVENDTLFPRVEIVCDGGDEDGYIIGYEYRVKTLHLIKGDSSVTDWKFFSEDSTIGILEIVFESSDSLNQQIVQVRSMDNDSAVDPIPAVKKLFTPETVIPETEIVSPPNNSQLFYQDGVSDWWKGIEINFTATDEDGEVVSYGWSLDGSSYTWTTDTSITLTPSMFSNDIEGRHDFKVISKDNTNLIDSAGASIRFNLIKAIFNKNILIIDDTQEGQFPSSADFDDHQVDSMYSEIFSPDTSIDYADNGMPGKDVLGDYKLLIWHSDNPLAQGPHNLVDNTEDIRDYLESGGDIIVTGWQVLKSFAYEQDFPMTFEDTTFVGKYLHIREVNSSAYYPGDFYSANGLNDIPSVSVNTNLVPSFPYIERLNNIEMVTEKGPFTEIIMTYIGDTRGFLGQPVGIRYLGTQFNVIVLTFPITFLEEEDRKPLGQKLLEEINHKQ